MHVTNLTIRNIKCLSRYEFSLRPEEAPGWHVILGGNGSGKTTFLRSLALALAPPFDKGTLNVGSNWRRLGIDTRSDAEISISANQDLIWDEIDSDFAASEVKAPGGVILFPAVSLKRRRNPSHAMAHSGYGGASATYWNLSAGGWFGACYGPYRRLTGGNPSYESFVKEFERLAPYSTIFNEGLALAEGLSWLIETKRRAIVARSKGQHDQQAEATVEAVTRLLNASVHTKPRSEVVPQRVVYERS